MYLLLLVFGGVLTAAGISLGASGVSIHDRTFDTTIVTPGVVAAVGGLLLIGLGLALRVLQRIEQAIAQRRIVPLEGTREPAPIPLPKPALHPVTAPIVAASAREKHVENLPEAAPALARLESKRVAEEAELSSPPVIEPALPTSVDVAVAEAERARTAKRRNGAVPDRLAPRLDMSLRSPGASERPAGPSFDALWPKGQRLLRSAPPVPAQAAVAPAEEPEASFEPAAATVQTLAPDAVADAAPEPVSVLKSGVVDGMAYTLYSDGSIEAQLPQGMLRFGSITELRNHIEQSA
jgi:hypothetical protein